MNSEKLLKYIEDVITEDFISDIVTSGKVNGITASEIEEQFSVFRSNASMLLNQLCKNHRLIKINSRPVYFLPVSRLTDYINDTEIQQSYSPQDFTALLSRETRHSAFETLIGCNGSLATQIEKAKASILYPPNGLHTLIVGESGTGKTVFANAMYNFGLTALHKNDTDFPFVSFNCSDYYHNPQLLMSHLFGHVKGAFTGAETNQEGLVEKANGGILFLDEIHRLPPEGQEMLFYLLDTGTYRRLGETKSTHNANIRIIGATTENPEHILLKTFQRRIPLTIEMPSYRDKSVEERIKIIEFIFNREALATLKQYIVSEKIIKALSAYPFPENIGQLSSEIKVLCARSLLSGSNEDDKLKVPYNILSKPIRDYYESHSSDISSNFPLRYESKSLKFPISEELPVDSANLYNEKAYYHLVNNIEDCFSHGYTKQDVKAALSNEIHNYCNHIVSDFYEKTLHTDEMYKVIDKDIVDFTMNIASTMFSELEIEVTQKNILVLAFHFKYLIERKRVTKDLSESDIDNLKEEHSKELSVARKIVHQLTSRFKIHVDSNEKYLIALILTNMQESSSKDKPALIIIAHGKSTATSIANVCNELMGCSIVQAVDVPLNQNLSETYTNVLMLVKKLNPIKGALLLVDMGSLIQLGNLLAEETGFNIKSMANLTTLQALNYTRLVLNASESTTINDILKDAAGIEPVNNEEISELHKLENAILSICASGAGTSSAFKSVIEKELSINNICDISVIALSAFDIQKNSPKYQAICSHYNIIAYISNMMLPLDVPFFHITDLITTEGKKALIDFATASVRCDEKKTEAVETVQNECIRFLNENAVFINPAISVRYSDEFIYSLNIPEIINDSSLQTALLLHLSFMIERNVLKEKILFDDMDAFIKENTSLFNKIKQNIHIISEPFNIDINDAEICYIIKSISGQAPR